MHGPTPKAVEPNARRATLGYLLALPLALCLGSCATPNPPPPVVTPTVITIRADANVNPNQDGTPSPIVIKLYDLRAQTNFMNASFFDLLDNDVTAIGPELLSKQEVEILPGTSKDVNHDITGEVKYLGVIAGFRDLNAAQWRASVAVVPGKTNYFLVTVTSLSVSVELNATRGKGWFGL
ncbi:type VI secretion system lipoprotein TssJ [Ancylobacter amanitiformis]|uniref:Type VI secretion system protein VasD n=1 Tax=Ancylobacter amanitiformis TaxID=217069 RepID=A0ABU0LL65_9HYPH|nr:type VI secretion system lipoprotein TssJ [Ancylobacter amanitiformis]MDQ0509450.1 type VI secretion system protein VasD [Ancylobacter amanitiformis]